MQKGVGDFGYGEILELGRKVCGSLGRFYGKEIYDQNGNYIGELGRSNRLIKSRIKDKCHRPAFSTGIKGTITAPLRDMAPYPMNLGFEDFLF